MESMSVAQLARFAGKRVQCSTRILGFCVDSRRLKPGEVFFALPGQRVDGHEYLSDVAKQGAIAAIVSKSYVGADFGLLLIRVENVLQTLQDLAKHFLAKRNPRIVAVTGSVGKTTTKEFIGTLLKEKYRIAVTPGNHNSQIGMPLAILNHTEGNEDILVVEMGMTQPGQIASLVSIAPPDVAVLTSVALNHAIHFDGQDEAEVLAQIARAKAEIFSHPKTQLGLINREIAQRDKLRQVGPCQKLSFSVVSAYADFSMKSVKDKWRIKTPDGEFSLGKFPFSGAHLQQNYLAALAVARYFGLSWEEIEAGTRKLQLPDLRFQIVEKQGITFVNDSYNACPASMKAALQNLPKAASKGRKIAVLGEMAELGKFSEKNHREIGECALEAVEKVFCLGKGCQPIQEVWNQAGKPVEWTLEFSELVDQLRKQLLPGDVVLLKGSNSNGLWKVLEAL